MTPEVRDDYLEGLAERFEKLRPRLFGIAYRMLGARADAEDGVQEAWIRPGRVRAAESSEALLVTTVTRLCIDHPRSARARRERTGVPWLPEPLVSVGEALDAEVEKAEALSLALLRVLDRLDLLERAVFLLREVFGYPYRQVEEIVERRVDHCRQIGRRARERVRRNRPDTLASTEAHRRLLKGFLEAADTGDIASLEALLDKPVGPSEVRRC